APARTRTAAAASSSRDRTADSPARRCRCRQWPRDRAPREPGRAQRAPSDPPARTHPPRAATAGVAPGPSCGTSSPSASSPRPTLCRVYHNLTASQRPSGHYSDGLLVSDTILDALARDVAARGAHPFVVHEGRRVTYAELDRLSSRAARALAALGVARGERVTLTLGNPVEYLVTAFRILKAGAVLNPLNPARGAPELDYIDYHAQPRVVAADAAHAPALPRHARHGGRPHARRASEAERTSTRRVVLGLGSAPIRERVIERFGVAHVAECYGSTDAAVVTITPVGVPPRAGSCGPPVPGVEIRILDDGGHDL